MHTSSAVAVVSLCLSNVCCHPCLWTYTYKCGGEWEWQWIVGGRHILCRLE